MTKELPPDEKTEPSKPDSWLVGWRGKLTYKDWCEAEVKDWNRDHPALLRSVRMRDGKCYVSSKPEEKP